MLRSKRAAYRESLREEILDAARQVFVRMGFEETSIRTIAAKVGASPAILYHYFEDKQDILAHLVRETFSKLSARMGAIRDDDAPLLHRLRRVLRAYIDFGLENPHHYAILFMKPAAMDVHQRLRQVFEVDGQRTFNCLQDLAAAAIAENLLRPELKDPVELAQALWVSIHGLVSAQIGARGFPFIERDRLIDRLVDILLVGIMRHD
jgi:AcrR family transcriptional regulator